MLPPDGSPVEEPIDDPGEPEEPSLPWGEDPARMVGRGFARPPERHREPDHDDDELRHWPPWRPGSQRTAAEFRRREVWPLGHGQVDHVLARHGTHRPSYARTPGPRYERAAANELWYMDPKGPFFFVGATGRARTCHFVALVDDQSRFLLGIRAIPTKEGIWVLALLEEAIELCGVPHELMTDNGRRSWRSPGRCRFQRSLAELSIRHIRTQIDTPWTNGKDATQLRVYWVD